MNNRYKNEIVMERKPGRKTCPFLEYQHNYLKAVLKQGNYKFRKENNDQTQGQDHSNKRDSQKVAGNSIKSKLMEIISCERCEENIKDK